MQSNQRGAKIYGYTVCVIAIITFIIALTTIVTALMNVSDPLYSRYQNDSRLASFENFKVETMKAISKDAAYIPDEATLRTMYEDARSDTIAHAMHSIRNNIVASGISLFVAIALFLIHWTWMRRLSRLPQSE